MTYILDYINYNFKVTMSGMLSVSVFDKQLNREISVTQMSEGIQKVFDLTDNEFNDIFKNWVNVQSVILQNKVVDYQTEIYNKTGVKLEITVQRNLRKTT